LYHNLDHLIGFSLNALADLGNQLSQTARQRHAATRTLLKSGERGSNRIRKEM